MGNIECTGLINAAAIGCKEAFDVPPAERGNQDIGQIIDRSDVSAAIFKHDETIWRSLMIWYITTCKYVAFRIVVRAE